MDEYIERVRRRAYQIWLDEGRPEGRENVHWEMAREQLALEDRQNAKPAQGGDPDLEAAADPPEPAHAVAVVGEVPALHNATEHVPAPPSAKSPRREAAARTATSKASAPSPAPAPANTVTAAAAAPVKPAAAKPRTPKGPGKAPSAPKK